MSEVDQAQKRYRENLEAQSERAWRVGPSGATEFQALPAYDRMTAEERKAVGLPRPSATPSSSFGKEASGATTFEILVSWAAFPFSDRLQIDWLMLSVGVNGPLSRGARGDGLARFAVVPPITTSLTTCGQPLIAKDLEGEDQPGYYFLKPSLVTDQMFFFENPRIPYDTSLPEKGEFFRVARTKHSRLRNSIKASSCSVRS